MLETIKKRILLPKLSKVIHELSKLSEDIAVLEISENEHASRRVRKRLIDIKNIYFEDLQNEITNIRIDTNLSKGKIDTRTKKNTL